MWDQLTIGYLAGLIDGEGHIKVAATEVQLTVTSTDYDIVERAHQMSGIGHINGPYPLKSGKQRWNWAVANRSELARLLLAIYPLMSARRQAKIALATDYLAERTNRKPKNCVVCEQEFSPSTFRGAYVKAKYCSSPCRDRAYKIRRKEASCHVRALDPASRGILT